MWFLTQKWSYIEDIRAKNRAFAFSAPLLRLSPLRQSKTPESTTARHVHVIGSGVQRSGLWWRDCGFPPVLTLYHSYHSISIQKVLDSQKLYMVSSSNIGAMFSFPGFRPAAPIFATAVSDSIIRITGNLSSTRPAKKNFKKPLDIHNMYVLY